MLQVSDSFLNVDPDLIGRLKSIGIINLKQLRQLGAVAAWRKLVQNGLDGRLQSLLDLEAAVEGTRWQNVPLDRREELALCAISFSQGN
jgi:hypothetical protein